MDCQIENVYVDSVKMLQQAVWKTFRRKTIIPTVAMLVLGILFLMAGLGQRKPLYLAATVLYIALALLIWTTPFRAAKKEYRRMLKYYDGNIPETVVRFGDTVTLTQGDIVNSVPYNKLSKVSILNDCILLHNEVGGVYMLAKDGFTKGSVQEMLALLKERCPKMKLPDWQWE